MVTSVVTPPAVLPVSLATAKEHLRIDHEEDDTYITGLVDSATQHVEAYIQQKLIFRTLRQYVDVIPHSRNIILEAWPVAEILGVTGYDASGQPVAISSEDFRLDQRFNIASLVITTSALRNGFFNGLEIDFTSGYGETEKDIPPNLVRAILHLIAHWYEFRGSSITESQQSLPNGIEKLLNSARRLRL